MNASTPTDQRETAIGLGCVVGAHVLWGVFPLFWRQFGEFDELQIVCHRVLWAFLTLLAISPLLIRGLDASGRLVFNNAMQSPRIWCYYLFAGALIAVNWLTFIWAVNHDRVLEASLGYYINPLLNVLMGVLILGERLTPRKWTAVAIAATGVAILTIAGGGLPWVSLVLAVSFSTYALVKKKAPLPALLGLLFETTTLVIPAILFLSYVELGQGGAFQSGNVRLLMLLVLSGTITILPLALFAFAAHRVALSTMGVLQYIAPTMQFITGIWLLGEPFDRWRLLGFACVWLALIVYLTKARTGPLEGRPTDSGAKES